MTSRIPEDCCGCSACAQTCPRQCIRMIPDSEGFEYPHVDLTACIDCGLCSLVCPVLKQNTAKTPLQAYAAKNNDEETRRLSSSGGVFTSLAESVLKRGGVVFGASFDRNWDTVHTYTGNMDGLSAFRGSKYTQSRIGTSYRDAETFLNEGREVLFSGTPCQIAGLKGFLRKDYSRLFTVEILCHGVPSPKVWQKYLDGRKKKHHCSRIIRINFRDKGKGWKRYRLVIEFENGKTYAMSHKRDRFLKGFLKNLYLRPSCYTCKCKNGRSGSDITLADHWNIDKVLPGYNDGRGTSLVLVNTDKGASLLQSAAARIECIGTGFEECIGRNGGFTENIPVPRGRERFFKKLNTK